MKDSADAELFGGRQALLVIVDVEGPRRIKTDQFLARRPILRAHFEPSHLERIHDPVDLPVETGFGSFNLHARPMRVRENRDPLSEPPQRKEKRLGIGQEPDHVVEFAVHRHHIDLDLFGPIMQIGPGEFPLH